MKFIWEVTDIKPVDSCGRTFLGGLIENTKTTASNRFSILGYEHVHGHQRIILVSLDDGLQIASYPVEEMVDFLNDGKYAPVVDIHRIEIRKIIGV